MFAEALVLLTRLLYRVAFSDLLAEARTSAEGIVAALDY